MPPPPNDPAYTMKVINDILRRSRANPLTPPDAAEPDAADLHTTPFSRGWSRVKREQLDEWVAAQMDRGSPPIFELASPERVPPVTRPARALMDVRIERREDSGALEMRVSTSEGTALPDIEGQFLQDALRVATERDFRRFDPVRSTASQAVLAEVGTYLTQWEMPVLGPGGRVTIYREPEALQADVVIRRLLRPIPAQWRQSSEISRRVRSRMEQHEYAEIQGALGYFELSKYDRQTWMRPAFVFLVDIEFSADRNIAWRETIVEPASQTPELGSTEGLGAWVG